MDEVWRLTQTPGVHQRWDLRFTTIEYLPRPSETEPQRFLYVTKLLPGLAIKGTGESTGERTDTNGNASSALRFGSDQNWSLIRTGSGYWRYIQAAGEIRFFTWYDYEVRFGIAGRLVNACILRPAMGWATAWSFDRLRLWVEKRQPPEISFLLAAVHTITRVTIAFVWIWHGAIPKLLFRDVHERIMLSQAGLSESSLPWIGLAEVGFGLLMLAGTRWRWLFGLNIAIMLVALAGVAARSPQYLHAAFNPVTLNLCVIALSVIGLWVSSRVPSARNCMRKQPQGDV
jgi:hypothetical protein